MAGSFGSVQVTVKPEVLRRTAREVSAQVRVLREDFNALQARVERTRGYWIGAAGERHRARFSEQKGEIDEILTLLGKYPGDLLETAQIYLGAEEKNTAASQVLPSHILD